MAHHESELEYLASSHGSQFQVVVLLQVKVLVDSCLPLTLSSTLVLLPFVGTLIYQWLEIGNMTINNSDLVAVLQMLVQIISTKRLSCPG
jgi:hypothetical protein